MAQYKLGSYSAFEELYQRHSGRTYGYLVSKTREQALAQDLLQTSFLKLHEKRDYYDPKFKFMPWFFTIVQNTLRDHFRSQKRKSEFLMEQPELSEVPSPSIPERIDLESAPITEVQKVALQMRYEQDLEFEEIGKRLNASSSNVRQLISRALKKLRGDS